MPDTQVVTVCLPAGTPHDQLATTAAIWLARHLTAELTPTAHFRTVARWRTGDLLHPANGTAVGGPVGRLALPAMREHCARFYRQRYDVWQRVVAGTRPALPFWTFVDRHRDNPRRYSLDTAQRQYVGQQRISAMTVYNALPHRIMTLPTSHLEALQTGADAYAHIGWLAAVPAHAMLTIEGRLLVPVSERLTHLVAYLDAAHRHLDSLDRGDHLVALSHH